MPFDNFVTGAVAKELDRILSGGKIERIHQPERDELILHINTYANGEHHRHNLLISSNSNRPLIYISVVRSGNPQNPPGFCMLLRKHLLNGRIAKIAQVDDERIVRIDVNAFDELGTPRRRILVVELMGKHSNIMLLAPEEAVSDLSGKILDSIKHVYADMSKYRQILPGMRYIPPPPGKGIGPVMAEEIALHRDQDHFIRQSRAGAYTPLIYLDESGRMKDFHVFPLKLYAGMDTRAFPSVSAMLETYYEKNERDNRLRQKSADVNQILKAKLDKLFLKQQRLLEDLLEAENAEEYRRRGELITANIYRMEKGMKEVTLTDYAAEDGQETEVTIPLDPMRSPAQNAQQYFKKYSKAKTARVAKREQLDKTKADIDFLDSYRVFIQNAETDGDVDAIREELRELGFLRRRKNGAGKTVRKSDRLQYESSAGRRISVGRNNKENDELTLRRAKPTDIWLHTKDIPGSHVILAGAADGKTTISDDDSLKEAAEIAAYYSKARDSANVPVDYTLVKYVKKPAGAKPGMVVFTHNKTLYVHPRLPQNAR
ncbi:MAG: NFACT RNA binding domain-containing protein [Clostridiales Family XIII bacterium]|jgi:predicted ribosome quality control (RQC) complex YloA/Tae2 family protein|nr:NFACT RNA binding domain-containing protein [Clostridiales Family XIII bacterium]